MNVIALILLSLGGLFTTSTIDDSSIHKVRNYIEVNEINESKINSEIEKYVEVNNITAAQKAEYLARIQDFEPTANITKLVVKDSNTIKVGYDLKDDSGLLLNNSTYSPEVRLYEGNTLIDSVPAKVGLDRHVEFAGLDLNTNYKVIVSGPYDLLGYGTPYNEEPYTLAEGSITTDKETPTANIHLTTDPAPTEVGYKTIKVHYDLVDNQNALIIDTVNNIKPRISLYKVGEEKPIKTAEATVGLNNVYEYKGLEPNTQYEVVIKGKYDLDSDGKNDNPSPFILADQIFTTTEAKVEPIGMIHTETDPNPTIVDEDSIEVHFDLTDEEKALINEGSVRPKLVVYKGSELVYVGSVAVGENEIEPVEGLENNTTYTVNLTGQYDLNEDGITDNVEPYILDSEDFTTGSKVDPEVPEGYIGVSTCKDLESIGHGENYPGATHTEAWELDANYALTSDIDCSQTNPNDSEHDTTPETTYGKDGFEPIAQNSQFIGILDGQGYTIDGLYVYSPEEFYIGLVGKLSGGLVEDLNLTNVDISGKFYVGGIVGNNETGTINNVSVTGNFYGNSDVASGGVIINCIGGIVGNNENGVINSSNFNGNIKASGYVGGIAGNNSYGSILNSSAQGLIQGFDGVGGIVGFNGEGMISDSSYEGTIGGESRSGGIAGINNGTISNSFVKVLGIRGSQLGGIAGENNSQIINVYSIVDLRGVDDIGGIVGSSGNNSRVSNTYSTGNITGNNRVGGIVGSIYNNTSGDIINSYTSVNIKGAHRVGGIVGSDSEENLKITNSYKYENQSVIGEDNTRGDIVTLEELNNTIWYTDVLGFDSNWNIEPISLGYYPHIMKADLTQEVKDQDNVNLPML